MNEEVIKVIGKEKYIELLKKYNLCTKKWTYGRTKYFYKEIKRLYKKRLPEYLEELYSGSDKE